MVPLDPQRSPLLIDSLENGSFFMFPVMAISSPALSSYEATTYFQFEPFMEVLRMAGPYLQKQMLDELFNNLHLISKWKDSEDKLIYLHNQGWDLEALALRSLPLDMHNTLLKDTVEKEANAPHILLRQRAYWACAHLVRNSYLDIYPVAQAIAFSKLTNEEPNIQQEGLAYYTLLFKRRLGTAFQEDPKISEIAHKVASVFSTSLSPAKKDSATIFYQSLIDFYKLRSFVS